MHTAFTRRWAFFLFFLVNRASHSRSKWLKNYVIVNSDETFRCIFWFLYLCLLLIRGLDARAFRQLSIFHSSFIWMYNGSGSAIATWEMSVEIVIWLRLKTPWSCLFSYNVAELLAFCDAAMEHYYWPSDIDIFFIFLVLIHSSQLWCYILLTLIKLMFIL